MISARSDRQYTTNEAFLQCNGRSVLEVVTAPAPSEPCPLRSAAAPIGLSQGSEHHRR